MAASGPLDSVGFLVARRAEPLRPLISSFADTIRPAGDLQPQVGDGCSRRTSPASKIFSRPALEACSCFCLEHERLRSASSTSPRSRLGDTRRTQAAPSEAHDVAAQAAHVGGEPVERRGVRGPRVLRGVGVGVEGSVSPRRRRFSPSRTRSVERGRFRARVVAVRIAEVEASPAERRFDLVVRPRNLELGLRVGTRRQNGMETRVRGELGVPFSRSSSSTSSAWRSACACSSSAMSIALERRQPLRCESPFSGSGSSNVEEPVMAIRAHDLRRDRSSERRHNGGRPRRARHCHDDRRRR